MTAFRRLSRVPLTILGVAALALAAAPEPGWAHGAHIQTQMASGIEVQAAYDSGEPMAEAQVQVYAPDNPETPAFSGVTDANGRYLFVPDQPGDWEVSVRQAGHGDIAVIPVAADGAIASEFTNDAGLNPLQRIIIAGSVAWGCVGTALYFSQRRKR